MLSSLTLASRRRHRLFYEAVINPFPRWTCLRSTDRSIGFSFRSTLSTSTATTASKILSTSTVTSCDKTQWEFHKLSTRSLLLFDRRIHHLKQQHRQRHHHREINNSPKHFPPRLTIARAARLFRTPRDNTGDNARMLTSQNLCQHCYNLAIFGEKSLHLNAYAKLLSLDDISAQARASDERLKNGTPKSLLDGIPVTIKANIAVGRWWEVPNAGSAILTHGSVDKFCVGEWIKDRDNHFSNRDDSECSSRNVYESDIARKLLQDCGAVLIGITNMDEFGMGSLGVNNGLHHSHSDQNSPDSHFQLQQQQRQQRREEKNTPTYNPLPWMHRITSLLASQTSYLHRHEDSVAEKDADGYWLQQIKYSSPENPHGVEDENALNDLLKEAHYWTHGFSNDSNLDDTISTYETNLSPLLSPGGSSSGAAVTTAHGSSLLSLGTDTGGSLRLPSAWTSTVGFKPTYGTWSRYGVVSYASSLDTVGYVAASVECAEIAWRCLSGDYKYSDDDVRVRKNIGWDGRICRDPTARIYHSHSFAGHAKMKSEFSISDQSNYQQAQNRKSPHIQLAAKPISANTNPISLLKPLANIRIGIPTAFSLTESPPLISRAWSMGAHFLQNAGGATLVSIPESKVSSEWVKLSCAAYYVLACAEASSNLSRYDGVRFGMDLEVDAISDAMHNADGDSYFHPLSNMTPLERQISATRAYGFGEEVQRRILAGTAVLSSDRFHTHYEAAAVVRARLSQSLERVFRSTSGNEDGDYNVHNQCDKVDVMLVPTALSFPCTLNPSLGGKIMERMDSTAAFSNDVMTITISLGGFPSVSVPIDVNKLGSNGDGCSNGVKEFSCEEGYDHVKSVVGLQIFGAKGSEALVLKVAKMLDAD